MLKFGIHSSNSVNDTARVGLAFAQYAPPSIKRTIGEWCLDNERHLDDELRAICYYRIIRGYEDEWRFPGILDEQKKSWLLLLAVKGNCLCSKLFPDPNDSDRNVFLPYCAEYSLSVDPTAFDFWADSLARQPIGSIRRDTDYEKIMLQRVHSAIIKGSYEHAGAILDSLERYESFNQSLTDNGYSSLSGIMEQRPVQYYALDNRSLSSWTVRALLRKLSYRDNNTEIPLEKARLAWFRKDNQWSKWLDLTFSIFVNRALPSNDNLLIAEFAAPDYYAPYEDLKNACAQYNNNDARQVYNAALFLKGSVDQIIPFVYRWIKKRCSTHLAQSLDTFRQYDLITENDWEEFEATFSHGIMNDIKELFPSFEDIATILNDDECAIEIVRTESLDLPPTVRYKALMLSHDSEEPVQITEFDELELRNILLEGKTYDNDALYKLLWEPIRSKLEGKTTIFISPDGILNLINLGALKTPEGHIFGDLFKLITLSSTREIPRLKANDSLSAIPSQIALFGGLDFKKDYSLAHIHDDCIMGARSNHRLDRSICRGEFRYLPSTLTEISEISKAIPQGAIAQTFMKENGTEEAFKRLSGKGIKIIHLATHGFYYTPSVVEEVGYFHSKQTTDPLSHCGLILTSGNNAWKGSPVPEGSEDGILLGEEIARMDLTDTDFVVLSACNTALGDISPDGITGLRKAFKRAGVKTLLMTLDRVDDKATCTFMTEFYRLLFSGVERHEAFKGAVNYLRGSEHYSSPKYWAPFIMLD